MRDYPKKFSASLGKRKNTPLFEDGGEVEEFYAEEPIERLDPPPPLPPEEFEPLPRADFEPEDDTRPATFGERFRGEAPPPSEDTDIPGPFPKKDFPEPPPKLRKV